MVISSRDQSFEKVAPAIYRNDSYASENSSRMLDDDSASSFRQKRIPAKQSYAFIAAEANKATLAAAKEAKVSGMEGKQRMGFLSSFRARKQNRSSNNKEKIEQREKKVVDEICKDSRNLLQTISGDDDNGSISVSSSEDRSEETSVESRSVIGAPSRGEGREQEPIREPNTADEDGNIRTLPNVLPVVREDSELNDEDDDDDDDQSSLYDDSVATGDESSTDPERPSRSVTPTAIIAANNMKTKKNWLLRIPTFQKNRTHDDSSSLKELGQRHDVLDVNEDDDDEAHQLKKRSFIVIAPTTFQELPEKTPVVEKKKGRSLLARSFRRKNNTTTNNNNIQRFDPEDIIITELPPPAFSSHEESANATPAAPAEEQQVSKSQVVADYSDEKETNSVTTAQSSTMAVVDHTNSSWCHVLGNVCFLGQQAECPHCHESVYKWSGHMKQYMYDINDETSRCQYFHVNCHSERTEVEKKMAAVREEFDFLNTRYTETRKKEKEEARRKRNEEKEAQKKKLDGSRKSNRKWNFLARKEKKN